jgi:hypothetical protein
MVAFRRAGKPATGFQKQCRLRRAEWIWLWHTDRGALFSTPSDYLRFGRILVNGAVVMGEIDGVLIIPA